MSSNIHMEILCCGSFYDIIEMAYLTILILVYSQTRIARIILNPDELGRGLVCALYTPRFHRTWDLEPAKKIPQSRYSSLYALDSSPLCFISPPGYYTGLIRDYWIAN